MQYMAKQSSTENVVEADCKRFSKNKTGPSWGQCQTLLWYPFKAIPIWQTISLWDYQQFHVLFLQTWDTASNGTHHGYIAAVKHVVVTCWFGLVQPRRENLVPAMKVFNHCNPFVAGCHNFQCVLMVRMHGDTINILSSSSQQQFWQQGVLQQQRITTTIEGKQANSVLYLVSNCYQQEEIAVRITIKPAKMSMVRNQKTELK